MSQRPVCPSCLGTGTITVDNARKRCFVCVGWGVVDKVTEYPGGTVATLDMNRPNKPVAHIICEDCGDENNSHPVHQVCWDGQAWLCSDCYGQNRRAVTTWKDAPCASDFITVQLPE